MSDEQFKDVVTVVLKTKKFYKVPLPAELLEAANGKPQDAAILALEKVERAIREVGSYFSVVFDDPVIHRTIEGLGRSWQGICEMPIEEWKFARKDFIKMYETFSANPSFNNVSVKLIGRTEDMNELNGYYHKSQEVRYIGDKAKALTWTALAIHRRGNLQTQELRPGAEKWLESNVGKQSDLREYFEKGETYDSGNLRNAMRAYKEKRKR